jgi:hypothetical protein
VSGLPVPPLLYMRCLEAMPKAWNTIAFCAARVPTASSVGCCSTRMQSERFGASSSGHASAGISSQQEVTTSVLQVCDLITVFIWKDTWKLIVASG